MGEVNRHHVHHDLNLIGVTSDEMLVRLVLPSKWDEDYAKDTGVHAAFDTFLRLLPGMVDGILTQAKESSVRNSAIIQRLYDEGMQGHSLWLKSPEGFDDAEVERYEVPETTTDFRLDGVEEMMGVTISEAAARARLGVREPRWRQEFEQQFPPPERCPAILVYAPNFPPAQVRCSQVAGHPGDCGAEVGD